MPFPPTGSPRCRATRKSKRCSIVFFMSANHIRISKFLSLVLRHEPQKAGLTLDSAGWVDVDTLLRGCTAAGVPITRAELDAVVAQSDKQRFAFSEDRTRIRANQGHSVEVELDYAAA